MTCSLPAFMFTEFYRSDPVEHLTEDAPEDLREEFEEYRNEPEYTAQYRVKHPEIKDPWYTWDGKLIERSAK